MRKHIIVLLTLLLLTAPVPLIGEESVEAATTIQIRPTGIFPTDRITVQDAIDAGYDEIVLMSKTASGDRVDWNFGGPPTVEYTPEGKVVLPGADQVDARTFGVNADDISGVSQNLIIRGETLTGTDADGDPDFVVLNGASLAHAFTSGGFEYSWAHPDGGSYNLTVKNLHFKNSPGAAMAFGSNGEVLIKNCKISSPRQVYYFGYAWLRSIMSWGSFETSGIPDANNWWEVFPKGSITVKNCIIDATMEYAWDDLNHNPAYDNPILDQYLVGIHMHAAMNSEILIENNFVKNGNKAGIIISNPIIPLNDSGPVKSVTVRNNTVYTKDYDDSEVYWWPVGFCDDNWDPGQHWEAMTNGIEINMYYFPLATAMPVTIEHNHVITKSFLSTSIQVFGPVNGLVIRNNTLDCGPSQFTRFGGYTARVCIMITSEKCPDENPVVDAEGYGAQNILVEKNILRGEPYGGILIRDWASANFPERQPRAKFTDIRLVKNNHQFLDHIIATYSLSEDTHDCLIHAKPPKQNLEITNNGTDNIIIVPGY